MHEGDVLQAIPEKSDNVDVLDEALGVGIVFTPEVNKFGEMVGSENGPVPGQVVKVVHDDSDEEVEHEEGADNKEADEVGVGNVRAAAALLASVI